VECSMPAAYRFWPLCLTAVSLILVASAQTPRIGPDFTQEQQREFLPHAKIIGCAHLFFRSAAFRCARNLKGRIHRGKKRPEVCPPAGGRSGERRG
jgi:hypothetical protein